MKFTWIAISLAIIIVAVVTEDVYVKSKQANIQVKCYKSVTELAKEKIELNLDCEKIAEMAKP